VTTARDKMSSVLIPLRWLQRRRVPNTLTIVEGERYLVHHDTRLRGGTAFLKGSDTRRFSAYLPAGTVLLAVEPRPGARACWFVVEDEALRGRLAPSNLALREHYAGYAFAFSAAAVGRLLVRLEEARVDVPGPN
jgi:hypothetical protein